MKLKTVALQSGSDLHLPLVDLTIMTSKPSYPVAESTLIQRIKVKKPSRYSGFSTPNIASCWKGAKLVGNSTDPAAPFRNDELQCLP